MVIWKFLVVLKQKNILGNSASPNRYFTQNSRSRTKVPLTDLNDVAKWQFIFQKYAESHCLIRNALLLRFSQTCEF